MTLASLLSCSLLCRVLSVHFTSLDPHPASDLKHVDLYSGISVGPLFRSARHWFTSCWHNLCLSLSLSLVFRLTCCWPRAALWSWNLMRCLPFPSLFHSQEYFSVLSGLAEDGRIYRSLLQTLLNFSAKQTEICLQSCFIFFLQLRTGISQHWGLFRQTLNANLNYLSAQDPTKTLHPIPRFLYNKSASRQRAVAAGASFTFSVNKVCC